MSPDRAADLAALMSRGTWTHDHPLMAADLAKLGFPIKVGVGTEERELMSFYPQPRGRQSPVEYFPGGPGPPPGIPPGRERPRSEKSPRPA
jgi:hypothetical protein